MDRLNQLFLVSFSLIAWPALSGFVLLSGPSEAKLGATSDHPEVIFHLSPEGPGIKKKEAYLDGKYANLSDNDLWPILVKEAMEPWNKIRGSFVKMTVEVNGNASLNSDDLIHSIVVSQANLTSAAAASPMLDGSSITDCDIFVASRAVSAQSLAFTLMHEIGHCLGLGHNHANYAAVMGYAHTSNRLALSTDDIAGILYLYPDPAFGDDKPKELIRCGTVATSEAKRMALTAWLLILSLPFLASWFSRCRNVGTRNPEKAKRARL